MEQAIKKVPFGRKLGYSVGIASDTFGYSLYYTFFAVFLTLVVGLNPAVIGVISAISILWDGLTDPIVGYMADLKPGRRSKMILWGSIPYALSIILTFTAVNFGNTLNIVYYTALSLAFWLFYTFICVPFYAGVVDMTPDYNQRTEIRSFSAGMAALANLVIMSTPLILVGFFGTWIGSDAGGWTMTTIVFGIGIIIFSIICSTVLKRAEKETAAAAEHDTPQTPKESITLLQNIGKFFRELFGILKLKPVLIIFIAIIAINIFRGFTSTGFVFFMLFVTGLDEGAIGLAFMFLVLSWFLFFPVINWICRKWDRKFCFMLFVSITAVFRAVIAFTPLLYTVVGLYINIFISNFLTTAYLALAFAMAYDIGELYEFKNNGRRADSTLQAVPLMAQKIGAAAGALLWGLALAFSGFDGAEAVQSPEVVRNIAVVFGGYINILLVLFLVPFAFYKLSKKKVALLQAANEARKAGEPYTTEGIEDIL